MSILLELFPRETIKAWHIARAPVEITWPTFDDPIWPEDMPLWMRAAPEQWRVQYWWENCEWGRRYAPRIALGGVAVAIIAAVSMWIMWGQETITGLLGFALMGGVLAAGHALCDWWKYDPRDWSHMVAMWPHARIQKWTDGYWQERPRWWPRMLWTSMRRGTYRNVVLVLQFPFAAIGAIAFVGAIIAAVGFFSLGLVAAFGLFIGRGI